MHTFTKTPAHVIFAVQYKDALIAPEWKEDLNRMLTYILQKQQHKMLAVSSLADHVHLVFEWNVERRICDLMRHLKAESSAWINRSQKVARPFRWQPGYGCFSISYKHVDEMIDYVMHQELVHREQNFLDEFRAILRREELEFDERYFFRMPE
jgi:putative transposase